MDPSIHIKHLEKRYKEQNNKEKRYKDRRHNEQKEKEKEKAKEKDKEKRTKIVNYSPLCINEVTICHKIENIPYYSTFFSIMNDYEPIHISQVDHSMIEKVNNSDQRYYLFKYDDKYAVPFIDVLYNKTTTIRKLISDMIFAFQHLVEGLILLNANDICFFDISPKHILFLKNYREKPVISQFEMSLNLRRLSFPYISSIITNIDDFTYKPFEIHILYYFAVHKITTISHSFIEEFCDEFIENISNSVLRLFSNTYKQTYKQQCIETLKTYINRSTNDILDDILERSDKWDVYGISMMFIHIFGCISRVFSLKGKCISKITVALMKNLHPDSDQRMSLDETLNVFNTYLHEESDWQFINHLDNHKLSQLLDEFGN